MHEFKCARCQYNSRISNQKRYRTIIFSIGAIVMFIFLIPMPAKAISAIASWREMIVPLPYCGWRILSPTEKSEALFFGGVGFLMPHVPERDPAEANTLPKDENPPLPAPNMLFVWSGRAGDWR